MARFKYQGRDRKGKKSGIVSADSKREALLELREKGIKVIDMKELPETFLTKEINIGFGETVKTQQFVIFLRQFSKLLKAGVTLVDSTVILAQQTESKPLRKALLAVEQDLRGGRPLSEAVAKHHRL